MGNLDREAAIVWKCLRLLRASRLAGDMQGVSDARFDLEIFADITKSDVIRERCTRALIADDNLPQVVALPA